jgi:hypothetical protein
MDKIQRIKTRIEKRAKSVFSFVASATVIITVVLLLILRAYYIQQSYVIGSAGSLLSTVDHSLAMKLKYDEKGQLFNFDNEQSLPANDLVRTGAQQISAKLHKNSKKGITVTDPINKVDFGLTPKYELLPGKQDGNRVVYPLVKSSGWAVYTMQGTGVKEDLLLKSSGSD